MTLRQLYERLGDIVQENDKRDAWAITNNRLPEHRNDNDIMLEVYRGGRAKSHYYPIRYASSSVLGVTFDGVKQDVAILYSKESNKKIHES